LAPYNLHPFPTRRSSDLHGGELYDLAAPARTFLHPTFWDDAAPMGCAFEMSLRARVDQPRLFEQSCRVGTRLFDRRPVLPSIQTDRKSTRLNSSHLGISY